jgi:3-oxoacyl-[acyl-carrier-protein] synthase II
MEPSFVATLALATLAVQHGALFGPLDAGEAPMTGALRQALVTGWGHWRGEAMALVTPA